jgi:hypothetical protein
VGSSADEIVVSSAGAAACARRSTDPSTVLPRLAEAAAENVDEIRRTLLEAATAASKPAWVEFECSDCGNRKRVEVPIPDVRARVAALELLLREELAPRRRTNQPPCHHCPRSEAEARALDWDQLKALVVAYPEIEYLPAGLDSHRPNATAFAPHSTRRTRRRAQHCLAAAYPKRSRDLTFI